MAFAFVPLIESDDGFVSLESYLSDSTDENPMYVEGFLQVEQDSKSILEPLEADPIVRLSETLLTKIPWIIAGDEECVPLRNSPYCFGFEPKGTHIDVYFYEGTEDEVDNLIMEPLTITIETLVEASLQLAHTILDWFNECHIEESDEDYQEMLQVINEIENAWSEKKRAENY